MRSTRNSRLGFASIFLAACATVHAADRFWVVGTGTFGFSGSWSATKGGPSGASVPGAGDIAIFDTATTLTVENGVNTTNQRLDVRSGNVTFELFGSTYTTTASDGLFIGNNTTDVPRFTLVDGTIATSAAFGNLLIGSAQDVTGFLTVSTAGRIAGLPDMVVGGFGTGNVTVQNGGNIDGARSFIGENLSGVGNATVTGAGSRWTNTNEVYVGYDGFGTLNISSGGFVSSATSTTLANGFTSVGTANVTGVGSTFSTNSLIVGSSGTGTLSVRSGALLASSNSTLALVAGSSGAVTVSDPGSLWSDGASTVGSNGDGTVTIENGGRWLSTSVTLGANGAASGTVNVRGAGSLWSSSNVTVASLATGTLNVSAGGEVLIAGSLTINNPAGTPIGTVNLDGGSITASSVTRSGFLFWTDGTLTIKGGTFNNSSVNFTINGAASDDQPTLQMIAGASGTGFGGTVLTIGSSRQGALNINTSASLGVTDANLGSAGGSGTVTLATGGTLTASGSINLGGTNGAGNGNGTLNLDFGGAATAGSNLRLWPGGILNLNGGTLNVTNLLPNGGRVNFNSGEIAITGGGTLNDLMLDTVLGQAHVLSAGQTLRSTGAFSLTTDMTINGGALVTAGPLTNSAGTTIRVVGGSLNLLDIGIVANSVMSMEGGSLTVNNIVNGGELQLHAGASLNPSSGLSNLGTVTGSGQVTGSLINSASGNFRADLGQRLVITGATSSNAGVIEALGGEVEFTQGLTNNATGMIAGRNAILRFGTGLTNNGTLGLSFGSSDLFGTISNNSGGKVIVSGNSQATFWNSISNNSGAELRVSSGSTAVFFGPLTNSGTLSGGGVKIFEGGGSGLGAVSTPGSTVVESAATVAASFFREDSLTVNGLVTINSGGGTSHLNNLNIDPDGILDLKNNSLVLEAGDLAAVTSQIRSGLNQGTGITSSAPGSPFRLGSMSNNNGVGGAIYTSFQGIGGLTGDEVLIRYTRIGDLNLDGTVTISDFIDLASNFNRVGGTTWQMGDVNYDGSVTISDFIDLASNFGQSVSGAVLPISNADVAMLSDFAAANVPEPAGLALILSSPLLMRRRIRRMKP